MKELGWSDHASEDLEDIFNFYLLKSPSVAAKIHDSIINEAERLIEWPEIGVVEQSLEKYNFEFPFRSIVTNDGLYKIVYFITPDSVIVSRIWSCRKNPKSFKL